MAKTNYKPGDKLIVKIKPFEGLQGAVLTHNPGGEFKPLSVELDNNLGTWQFKYEDVEPLKKDKETFPFDEKPAPAAKAAAKTAKPKKAVAKPDKAKRPYNKKTK